MIIRLSKTILIVIISIFTLYPALFAACPPSYPIDCGNGSCCTMTYPYCCYGYMSGYCGRTPSACGGGVCALSLLLNGDETKLDALRETRDAKMMRTVLGVALISLYYQHSDEIVEILLSDEVLFDKALVVANEIAEKALFLNNNEEVEMSQEFSINILEIADAISAYASPALKKTIHEVEGMIIKKGVIDQLGIKVTE